MKDDIFFYFFFCIKCTSIAFNHFMTSELYLFEGIWLNLAKAACKQQKLPPKETFDLVPLLVDDWLLPMILL